MSKNVQTLLPADRLAKALASFTERYLNGGIASIADLEAAIDRYVARYATPSAEQHEQAQLSLTRRGRGDGWTESDAFHAGVVQRYEANLSAYEAIQAGIYVG
jgi:hypothetical protein